MTITAPDRQKDGWFWFAAILALVLIACNFVGYDGADDRSYIRGAEAWLSHFPVAGGDHWATRHTVVLPLAASLAVFGHKEWAFALPSLLYFLGFVWLNHHFARRYLGPRFAAIFVMLLAATPVFLVQASYANNDIAEVFFAALAFWLFVAGSENSRGLLLFASGLSAGLAFLTRETSAVLVLFYAFAFFTDPRPRRLRYGLIAAGFLTPLVAEMCFFWAMTGDGLYRYRLDAGHDQVSRLAELQHKARQGAALDRQGNLSVNLWADPFLMLFASQKYALLFFLALPTAFWAFRVKHLPDWDAGTLRRAARLMLLWIGFLSLAFPILYLVPRYYIVPAWAGVLLAACLFQHFWQRGWAKAAMAALALCNALSLYLENTDPRFAEEALRRWLLAHPGVVVRLDPDMARRADVLLNTAGLLQSVRTGPPRAGDIFVYSPRNLELCRNGGLCKTKDYQPQPGWEKLAAIAERPRALGRLLRWSGVAPLLPSQLLAKIEQPSPGIIIYRIPRR